MRIAVFSTKSYDKHHFDKANKAHELVYFSTALNQKTAELAKGFDGVCVFVNDEIDRPTIEKLAEHDIQLIALRCAGYNNVDLKAAIEKGIKVVRVPAYSPEAVAEHALALILTLSRKTHKAYNRVKEGNFSLENLTGFTLYKKTVGVIGTGKIGAAFCRIMNGLGCRILAYDLYPSDELKALGVEYRALNEVFQEADIISLHCPLTKDTYHMIDKQAIAQMKKGVMIINSSRGALINTKAIIKALKSHQIGYLGIDVYEQEQELFFNDLSERIIPDELILRLISFPNVLITSHQAFLTREALDEIASITLDNISAFEKGIPLENEVR